MLSQSLPKNSLNSQAPAASPLVVSPNATELADPASFPAVRYWNRSDFTKAEKQNKKTTQLNKEPAQRGNRRVSQDINVMTRYLENTDGSIVSGKEAQTIRNTQLAVYREIKQVSPDDLPRTWGDASLTVINYHRAQMYAAHPCLRLCRSHWKVDQLATNTYSSWYTKTVKKKAKANTKESSIGTDACTCICTCSEASPDPESDDEQDNLSPSASTSTSRSTPSAPPSTNGNKRKSRTTFIPSTQPRKRLRSSSPIPNYVDSTVSPPPTSTDAPSDNSSAPSADPQPPMSNFPTTAESVNNVRIDTAPAMSTSPITTLIQERPPTPASVTPLTDDAPVCFFIPFFAIYFSSISPDTDEDTDEDFHSKPTVSLLLPLSNNLKMDLRQRSHLRSRNWSGRAEQQHSQ